MALVVKDRVKETAAAPGTGTVSLGGAASGFRPFSDIGSGNTTFYVIFDPTANTFEVGEGTYTSGSPDTLTRDDVLQTSANNTTKVNFANAVEVFIALPADKSVHLNNTDNLEIAGDLTVTSSNATDQIVMKNTNTGTDAAPDLVLWRDSSAAANGDSIGRIDFRGEDDGSTARNYTTIESKIVNVAASTPTGAIHFKTLNASTSEADVLVLSGDAATFSGSVTVTTTVNVGTGGGFYLKQDSSKSTIRSEAQPIVLQTYASSAWQDRVTVRNSGNVGIGSSNSEEYPLFVKGSNISSGGGTATVCVLDSGTAYNSNPGGGITFRGTFNSSGSTTNFATVQGIKENTTDGNYASAIAFKTRANGGNLTEKMRVDSQGRVGIGTNSPDSPLEVSDGVENYRIDFGTNEVYLMARNASAYIEAEYIAETHEFRGYGNDSGNLAAKIDSSGNFMVGRTSLGISNTGHTLATAGYVEFTRDGAAALNVGRNTSFGDTAVFWKDGVEQGRIASENGYLRIEGGNGSSIGSGLLLTNSVIAPRSATGASTNGTIDLGYNTERFKDLYLGGTTYAAKGSFYSNSSNGQLTLENTASDYMMEFRRSGSSEWWFKASSSYFAIHENGSADHFTINSGGDIGMKCAAENNAGLEVNGAGNINSSSANVFSGRSNGGNGNNRRFNLIALADGNSTYGGGMKIQTRNNSNVFQDSLFIAQDRNAYFYGSINAYSAGAVGLEVKGDGSGYTQGAIVLRSHPSSGSPEYRGQGVYLFNEGADENWYSGTVYNETTQHRWMVCHQSNSSMSYDTAQVTYCKFSVQKDGRIGVNNSSPDVTIHAGYNGQPNHYNAMRIGTNYPTNTYTGKIDWCDSSNITASIYTVYDGTAVHMGIGSLYNSGHNTADKFTFRGDGEFRAIGNVIAYYSDERLKDFHGKIEGALDKVKAINGYYYTENEKAKEFGFNKKEKQVGVSAQEVEKVLPEVVTNAPFDVDQMNQSRSGENYKTVEYEKLVPLLIEAIKEQQTEIEELKAKVNALTK